MVIRTGLLIIHCKAKIFHCSDLIYNRTSAASVAHTEKQILFLNQNKMLRERSHKVDSFKALVVKVIRWLFPKADQPEGKWRQE